jgi:hypothetical protein
MIRPAKIIAAAIVAAAAVLAGFADAAPMGAPPGPKPAAVETAQFRGGNFGSNHPLMTGEGWNEHMRAWEAYEGRQSGNASAAVDCRRMRSYDRAARTYRGRDGRRYRCR